VRDLRSELDPCEAEAIVPAIEQHADLLLVEEGRGRRVAVKADLSVSS
jgi:predicted nucleic acid-binding protein